MVEVAALIGQELNISSTQAQSVITLLEQGSTIPFISRYRKEATGGLDEVAVEAIDRRHRYYTELEQRKLSILATIESQGVLTSQLRTAIQECTDSTTLEDIYLPYKPKRRTRATMAREKGLEPLAQQLLTARDSQMEELASKYLNDKVESPQDALSGASDIVAEWVAEDPACRAVARKAYDRTALLECKVTKGKEQEGEKYTDYFKFSQPLSRVPGHRILAMLRGQRDGFLKISLGVDSESVTEQICRTYKAGNRFVALAIEDSFKRLIAPSIEGESITAAKERADGEAIKVFANNLRQLLLEAPLGQRRVLAIDPGFRTGCKVVCLSAQGDLLHHTTIYPHQPVNQVDKSASEVRSMVRQYDIEAIAIGTGTAGRETEQFVRSLALDCKLYMVSEDGASVYSASEVARGELGDYDLTVRGSVSIGRRLMDPLAELVKIEPKAIGVGQYQHDVDQKMLKQSLDRVVESCVNSVGVNLNTASSHLLTYVSGLNSTVARNIVEYRASNGPFSSRSQLLKVPRLGAKGFEQSAGFMRIDTSANPLDNTAVHPESYSLVKQMADDMGVSLKDFVAKKELREQVNINLYVSKGVGNLTITAIMNELNREGRDSRQEFGDFEFTPGISTINDLKEGMVVKGIVTNITNFGAFVNIGVKQDGLVHISQMANRYVANPADVVSLKQEVEVKITEIDYSRGRIGLSMKALLAEE